MTPPFDLFAPDFFADPNPLLHRLRTEDPVHWSEQLRGWVVTPFADVEAILKDTARFSSDRVAKIIWTQVPDPDPPTIARYVDILSPFLGFCDDPQHTRARSLLHRVFTPQAIATLEPHVQRMVDMVIQRLVDKPELDGFLDLAATIPTLAICELVGAPTSDMHTYRAWVLDIIRLLGGTKLSPEDAKRCEQSAVALHDYLLDICKQRRAEPREDLISRMLAADGANAFELKYLASIALELIGAGLTVVDQFGNGLVALLRNPEQRDALLADPSLWDGAVSEMIRAESSVVLVARIARTAVELHGKRIQPGDLVFVSTTAAAHDPAIYADPDRFDIQRRDNGRVDPRPISFGTGPHICLGAYLGRLELKVGLRAVFERLPGLRLAGAVEWRQDSALFHGPRKVPLVRDVAARAA